MTGIKKLEYSVRELLDLLEITGDFPDMTHFEMGEVLQRIGTTVTMFEEDPVLAHLVMGSEETRIMLVLKTAAVTMFKAIPLQEHLDSLMCNVDWYELSEIVDILNDNLDREED